MPAQVEAYEHQVGGHSRIVKPTAESSKILKPYTVAEYNFYECLASIPNFVFHANWVDITPVASQPCVRCSYPQLLEAIQDGLDAPPNSYAEINKRFLADYKLPEWSADEDLLQGVDMQSFDYSSEDYKHMLVGSPVAASLASSFAHFTNSRFAFQIARAYPLNILKAFYLPRYHGLTTVQIRSTSRACPPDSYATSVKEPPFVEAFAPPKNDNCDEASAERDSTLPATIGASALQQSPGVQADRVLEYIVLDDLVDGYRRPCVLDLKMGRRQRKLGATEDKRRRQLEKSYRTTTYALGFRVCGFKVYDRQQDVFYCRDKYWGRELKPDKILAVLKQFFGGNSILYHTLISALLLRLKILYECIKNLPSLRFWSSSLLWVFDGGRDQEELRLASLDVKMIDFANTVLVRNDLEPDQEYLFGLNNLIELLQTLLKEQCNET